MAIGKGGKKMNLKPLGDHIVVKPSKAEEVTSSGLVLPDTAQEKPQQGEIVAVGEGKFDDEGKKRIPMEVKVGDKVLYPKYGGTEVKVKGDTYLIITQDSVLAIVK
jgi:chaperonin GroES